MEKVKEIVAISMEAKRKGTTYGKLVAGLTETEKEQIIKRYQAKREAAH